MPNDTRHAARVRDAKLRARCALFDGGRLLFFDGERPARADDPPADGPVVTFYFGAPAFGPPIDGVATSYPFVDDATVARAGTVTWARALAADGTPLEDYAAGRNGYAPDGVTVDADAVYNVNLSLAVLPLGARVSIASVVLTEPAQGA